MAKEAVSKKVSAEKEGILTKIWRYLTEVGIELKKTTWPSRAELARSTAVVIAAVIVVAVWIYCCEFAMLHITKDLLHMY
jgi:preprotein translocase subunit SecE